MSGWEESLQDNRTLQERRGFGGAFASNMHARVQQPVCVAKLGRGPTASRHCGLQPAPVQLPTAACDGWLPAQLPGRDICQLSGTAAPAWPQSWALAAAQSGPLTGRAGPLPAWLPPPSCRR